LVCSTVWICASASMTSYWVIVFEFNLKQ
jgi:hypothetical protein